jgi:hypothetical protein
MSNDKYFVSEAPEGNMPPDGLEAPTRKATTITVKAFFEGYMLAGMDGQEFEQLTPEQQLQERIDFLHDRASHIEAMAAGQVKREAARMVRSLNAAQEAVEAGDIGSAAMHFIDAGRWMERVMSSQVSGIALELADRPGKATEEKNRKVRQEADKVIEKWLSKPRRKGEKESFAIEEAERSKYTKETIYKSWLSDKSIQNYQNRRK